MRKLLDDYAAAVAARVKANSEPDPCGSRKTFITQEAAARDALDTAIAHATYRVAEAMTEVEAIEKAAPQTYADDPRYAEGYRANFKRPHNARRAFTLKDARPLARHSARLLREAWELLDPRQEPFK